MGPTALHSRRENLRGATLGLQRAFIRQGMLSAPINSAAEKYLTGLGHCSIFWAAWVLWAGAGSSGMQGHSTVRVWSWPFVLLPWSARPSHAITSYLKIHRCCGTRRTEGENILYCHFPPPHLSQLLPLPFSAQLVLSPPGCKSARAPRENVCSDRKLLFSRQELTQGLWLKEVFCIVYG